MENTSDTPVDLEEINEAEMLDDEEPLEDDDYEDDEFDDEFEDEEEDFDMEGDEVDGSE